MPSLLIAIAPREAGVVAEGVVLGRLMSRDDVGTGHSYSAVASSVCGAAKPVVSIRIAGPEASIPMMLGRRNDRPACATPIGQGGLARSEGRDPKPGKPRVFAGLASSEILMNGDAIAK